MLGRRAGRVVRTEPNLPVLPTFPAPRGVVFPLAPGEAGAFARIIGPLSSHNTRQGAAQLGVETAMLGIRNVTIKAKLYGLILFSAIGLSLVLGLALWVLHQYRINGPVYERISQRAAALAETEPSIFFIVQPYLALVQMSSATDPAEIQQLRDAFDRHEARFEERAAHWQEHLHEGPLKQALTRDVWPAGRDFFRVARSDYLPVVGKADGPRPATVLKDKIHPLYQKQRQVLEQTVQVARQAT